MDHTATAVYRDGSGAVIEKVIRTQSWSFAAERDNLREVDVFESVQSANTAFFSAIRRTIEVAKFASLYADAVLVDDLVSRSGFLPT